MKNFVFNNSKGFESSSFNSTEPFLMTLLRVSDALTGVLLFTVIMHFSETRGLIVYKADLVIFFFIIVFFHFHHIYRSFRFSAIQYEIYQIVFAALSLYIVLLFIAYIGGVLAALPRGHVLLWMGLWPFSISVLRLMARKVLRIIRVKGYNLKKAVIVGNGGAGVNLVDHVQKNPWSGIQIVGCMVDTPHDNGMLEILKDIDIIEDVEDLHRYVLENQVNIVYFSMSRYDKDEVQNLFSRFEDIPVSIHYIPDILFLDMIIGGEVVYFDRWPVIVLRGSPIRGVSRLIKRLFDVTVAGLAIVVLSPLMLCIAAAVRLTSSGPVFFVQHRYGINGRRITVYKFRTMTVMEQGASFSQATRNDPRITRVGSFLRRTSLDELPQLVNVVQGRMSLVGPRPHPVAMDESYRKLVSGYMIRREVKPGITGLAQVKGFRGETDTLEKMEKRVHYDLMYIREWSFMLDIELIIRTVFVFLFQKTAY